MQAAEPALVVRRRQRVVRDQRDHGGAVAGADLPEMQIGDAVAARLQALADQAFHLAVVVDVEQHAAGGAQQPDRPACDHDGADDADDRIGPGPLQPGRRHQRGDGEHGGGGVRQHVDIGGAKIVVAVAGVRVVMAVVVVMVVVLLAQQEGADEIDDEPEHGDRDRLAIGNRHRIDQPLDALEGDLDRDDAEDDGAGKGGEIAELAGAEGEMRCCAPGGGQRDRPARRCRARRHGSPCASRRRAAPSSRTGCRRRSRRSS